VSELPDVIRGTATRFGVWHSPTVLDPPELEQARFVFVEGCLDASIRRIRAGLATFKFLLDHDHGQCLCTSADGCLSVRLDGRRLRFALHNTGPAARLAMRVLRASGFRELSIGFKVSDCLVCRPPAGEEPSRPLVLVRKGRLIEVSAVAEGACPGSRLFIP
jgi:phage head maturation protease